MNKYVERLYNGLLKENPVLILMLGMCPALAVSTKASNGIGMGLSTMAVLILSNPNTLWTGKARNPVHPSVKSTVFCNQQVTNTFQN